jgi:ParB family chromosome partitioning protein
MRVQLIGASRAELSRILSVTSRGCLHRPRPRLIIPGMVKWRVHPDEEPTKQAQALAEQVEQDGGSVLAIYREPVGDHWHVFCLLPMDKVEPTPYQRDLSPTHVKRLQDVVKKIDRFVDPVVMMSPGPGRYWTPNGNHRRAVLAKLKSKLIPAILVPEPEVAYQILALNTEKAHNLKEKSLEVIRMYRGLVAEEPQAGEEDYAFQFESAHFITLGLLYEQNKRFAGGAFAPILRRVDKFLKGRFPKTLEEREERAALVREADGPWPERWPRSRSAASITRT